MGYALPSLDGELEDLGCLAPPVPRRFDPWKVVEGCLNLGYLKFLEVLIHAAGEAAASYLQQGCGILP